jgi:hypothetical protein
MEDRAVARNKVSRNAPCPCGSGKKFKHCCLGKGIDRGAEGSSRRRPVEPPSAEAGRAFLGAVYGVVDRKLKDIARASPEKATWKTRVENLAETTPLPERMRTYQAVRQARVIPEEAGDYLIAWAIQWMPDVASPEAGGAEDPDEEAGDEEVERALDNHTLALLRQFGAPEMAERYLHNRLEYDRRHERGRQFFYGPPNEELARHLRAEGVID